jgi:hypothetical protein
MVMIAARLGQNSEGGRCTIAHAQIEEKVLHGTVSAVATVADA